MKKEQWQAVYTPNNEEMLERRVRQTLSGLQEDAPARRISGRRMMLIAAALVLMLAAAVAAAAGWMRSAKYDAKLLAQEALYEKYGFVNCGTAQEYYESTGETEFVFYEYVLVE